MKNFESQENITNKISQTEKGDFDASKYHSKDYLRKMFIEKNSVELEKIKKIRSISEEQIELFCNFAILRQETIEKMQEEILTRKKINPNPSTEELSMGAYLEQIEPQIRETIVNLRKKGYNTYESGFGDFDSQRISFSDDVLRDFSVPAELKNELVDDKVKIIVKPNSISLKFKEYKDINIITTLWRKVEQFLPNLGKPSKSCKKIGSAIGFRKRFGK